MIYEDNNNGDNMFYYLNLFFIFSIIGYFIESFWSYICKEKFGSGMLFLPWTPIYGIGVIIIVLVFNFLQKYIHVPGWINCYLLAILMMIMLTIVEYIGGLFIEKVFHKTFWDYRPFKFNFGKYICLEISLIWGFASVIVAYLIIPFIKPYILIIPNYITIMFIIIFIIDNIATYISGKVHK